MGSISLVIAGHILVLIAAALFLVRMVPMAAAARRAELSYSELYGFPLCAMLIVVMVIVEVVYYGAARLLIPHGVNLWEQHAFVGVLRLCIGASVWCHMPAWLKWKGHDPAQIRVRIVTELIGLAALWLAIVWILW